MQENQQYIDYALKNIKENSKEVDQNKLNLTLEVIKKYISILLELGYIDYVNFNSIINHLNSISVKFENDNDPYSLHIDFNMSEENIIISICQKIGELLLNYFHKESIQKFSTLASSKGKVQSNNIKDGFYCINKALSYELAYQVFEYQAKENRNIKIIPVTLFDNAITGSWYKDNDIEFAIKLFFGYLLRSDKEESLKYMVKKSFDKFLYPQIINTKLDNIDLYLAALGCIKNYLDDNIQKQEAMIGANVLKQAYNEHIN